MSISEKTDTSLKATALLDLHQELGAKMVPFAGYSMPVQYAPGILGEHRFVRSSAGIFDISHMQQATLEGPGAIAFLEKITACEVQNLTHGKYSYTQILNDKGGIIDDMMITKWPGRDDKIYIVNNAASADKVNAYVERHLSTDTKMLPITDRGMIAVQGPKAHRLLADCADMTFLQWRDTTVLGTQCYVSRSGYTGEDGFELSLHNDDIAGFVKKLLAHKDDIMMIGLGARDSLRLEAGMCLYGQDLDEETTPIEADLLWSVGKRRRTKGGFLGADIVQRQIAEGVMRKRVGIIVHDRAPARAGAQIVPKDGGDSIGVVRSGCFSPTLEKPILMGYVDINHVKPETQLGIAVRGKILPAEVTKLPFVSHKYQR
ncbi:MAG: glycine cleavage system aminomethyltransferase GcvT [Pseudomonadota bacterium]